MKRFLLAITIICSLPACKKNKEVTPGLMGKWELRRVYGGLSWRDSVYKPGNGNVYQFSSDSTYKRYEKNQLKDQGNFHLRKYNPTDFTGTIIVFDGSGYSDYFTINGTKMTIGTTITDGIASDYQKIND